MKRLHRYLLSELLQNASLTVVAILAIFFMVALALVLGASRTEGVPFLLVMRHTGFKAVSTLYLTLPLTVLTACIFTYGRARSDGEFTATRVAGIHPWQSIVPAIVLGATCTLALCWLQGDAMPSAHFRGRVELERDLIANLEGLLKRKDKRIVDKSWSAMWKTLRQDEAGHIVLGDLQLIILDTDDRSLTETIRAAWAKPRLDTIANTLSLELTDLTREDPSGQRFQASQFSVTLHLESLGAERKRKRESDCTYEELLTRSRRYADRALMVGDKKARATLGEKSREYAAEYHMRIAFAFSAVLFAFLGSALGLWRGTGNRALVFMTGFLLVVCFYYPLEMAGMWLAVDHSVPPAGALWIGNGVLMALSCWAFRKVIRP
jgi:lipopolysaccharide export LptBFGC system permease protein LptF